MRYKVLYEPLDGEPKEYTADNIRECVEWITKQEKAVGYSIWENGYLIITRQGDEDE